MVSKNVLPTKNLVPTSTITPTLISPKISPIVSLTKNSDLFGANFGIQTTNSPQITQIIDRLPRITPELTRELATIRYENKKMRVKLSYPTSNNSLEMKAFGNTSGILSLDSSEQSTAPNEKIIISPVGTNKLSVSYN